MTPPTLAERPNKERTLSPERGMLILAPKAAIRVVRAELVRLLVEGRADRRATHVAQCCHLVGLNNQVSRLRCQGNFRAIY
jgi:hypothetical protein